MGKVLTYRITLTAPLILSTPGGDPNSAETLRFIPGSSIRGAMAGIYLRTNQVVDPAKDPDFRDLFLSDKVRYLNAYPNPNPKGNRLNERIRLTPVPLSLKQEKGSFDKKVFDMASKESNTFYRDSETEFPRQLIGLPGEFVCLSDSVVFHYNPTVSVRLHNKRDRAAGRPLEGEIFSYVSLQPGERFIGHILMEEDTHYNQLRSLLQLVKKFGRSRRTEYGGGINVEVFPDVQGKDSWREIDEKLGTPDDDQLTVTLLSDYISEDKTCQITISSDDISKDKTNRTSIKDFFINELNINGIKTQNNPLHTFIHCSVQGGYLGVWHLPLPQAKSIDAGSVLVLKTDNGLDINKLKDLEWKGVGSRRAEGFGRVCFNWHGKKEKYTYCTEITNNPVGAESECLDNEETENILTSMRRRLLEKILNYKLPVAIDDLLQKTHLDANTPSSLLGRFRAGVKNAKQSIDVGEWLKACKGKKAGKTLDKIIIDSKTLPEWITGQEDEHVWILLHARSACEKGALLDDKEKSLAILDDKAFIWEYQQKVIDALLSRMMDKLKKEK